MSMRRAPDECKIQVFIWGNDESSEAIFKCICIAYINVYGHMQNKIDSTMHTKLANGQYTLVNIMIGRLTIVANKIHWFMI